MRRSFALLTMAASALASPMPQGVTTKITPPSPAPEGCQASYPGKFQLTVVNVTTTPSKRDLEFNKRQLNGILTTTLNDQVLVDQAGRTAYIADNFQFQFDAPPQTGALYTAGFSVCANGTLALGGSAIFYQCDSGGFFNIYDRHWAAQCSPIYIYIQKAAGSPGNPVTQVSDGQPQGPTGRPITQISDGQPQGPPITQISDGQPQVPTGGAPITQISDGQPQVPTGGAPITQISDGQPQVPTGTGGGAPITQISDGQPQVPTGQPITQISDGQPQVPTGTGGGQPITQISDGQPQVPAPTISQISDGQPQVPIPTVTDTVIPVPSSNATATAPSVPTSPPQPSITLSPGAASQTTYGVGASFIVAFFCAIVFF